MSLLFEALTVEPDFSTPPINGVLNQRDAVEVAQATKLVAWPWKGPLKTWSYDFGLYTRTAINNLEAFISARGGRHEPFYLPSWERDLDVAEAVISGDIEVEIFETADGYAADYLTDDREDTPGRVVFFWMPNKTAHVTKVVRVKVSSVTGQEVLELETPVPFAFDPARGVAGFAYLVRFINDDFSWKHSSPQAAIIKLDFRQVRQWIDREISNTADELDAMPTGNEEPPETITQVPTTAYPFTHSKAAYCEGPDAYHTTQDEMFRQTWAFWLGSAGVRYRKILSDAEVGNIWPPNDSEGSLTTLFGGALDTTHLSVAFDQDGYEAIAWESDLTVPEWKIKKYVSTVVTEYGAFGGLSPVLFYTGITFPTTTPGDDCDIIAFYLKPNRNAVYCRVQRENFATERIWTLSSARIIKLLRAYREDRTMKIIGIDDGLRLVTWTSEIYPPEPFVNDSGGDGASSALSITAASVLTFVPKPEVVETSVDDLPHGAKLEIVDGLYFEATPPGLVASGEDGGAAALTINRGQFRSVLVFLDDQRDRATASLAIRPASFYFLTVKSPAGNTGDAGRSALDITSDSLYFEATPESAKKAIGDPARTAITVTGSYA